MQLPLLVVVAAYLLGSIPFSFLVVKAVAGKDIRLQGSRNVGATNVARTVGKLPGIIALVLDGAKGWGAVALARALVSMQAWPFQPGTRPWESREFWIALAGLIAVLGHMFPLWLKGHGGKGVATATGVFLALDPLVVAAALLVFAIVLLALRYVSLASIVSAASIPVFFRFMTTNAPFWRIIVSILIAIAIIIKHHENISRLVAGTERKLGQKKEEQR
ncbi:MAG TPA: glycerol-3-phosphate 1-O-acyltransferase PlsY [Thermoanaerobaculia bacterium]|jgi:glycerol-3-phosphate acyltransferase PlsY